jgi:hypothetical protein
VRLMGNHGLPAAASLHGSIRIVQITRKQRYLCSSQPVAAEWWLATAVSMLLFYGWFKEAGSETHGKSWSSGSSIVAWFH